MINPFFLFAPVLASRPTTRPQPRAIAELNAARAKLTAEEKRARRRARNLKLAEGERRG